MANPAFENIVSEIRRFAATAMDLVSLQEFCVSILAERLSYYDWVGFYMLDPADQSTLVLGPYRGAPTEHVRIPVTEGICGAAVAQGETVIVEDVSADPRYLACSLETKSEIVVPIRANGKILGEIDIDSHILHAFGPADRQFLEECADVCGRFLKDGIGYLAQELKSILSLKLSREDKAVRLAQAIREDGSFRWVGLYDVDTESGEVSNIAWSGPAAPAYPRFPVTKGLTSKAISEKRTVNVGDVSAASGYLTSFDTTRSEIIIPVFSYSRDRVIGTIDVESGQLDAFDTATQVKLEEYARLLSGFWTRSQAL